MTGWNLPPGCNVRDLPGAEDYPCEICGQDPADCICPECPACGGVGDPVCYEICPETGYPYHGLVRSLGQVVLHAAYLQLLEDEFNADAKYQAMIDTVDGGTSDDDLSSGVLHRRP